MQQPMRGKGKGKSMGHSRPRTSSGMRTLKRCRNNIKSDNVILIDVDSDNFDNVIIIDVPESFQKKIRGSNVDMKDRACSPRTVICIDDDNDDESMGECHPETGVKSDGNSYGETSSGMKHCSASNQSRNSANSDSDDCQFLQENVSPMKLSKCKRTYSGKAPRNRYGLSGVDESYSSDDGYPDCIFMEGSLGKEQWEKASSKRKYNVPDDQSGMCFTDADESVGLQKNNMQQTEAPVCSSSRETSSKKEGQSPCGEAVDGNLGSYCDTGNDKFADIGLNLKKKPQFPPSEGPSCSYGESQNHDDFGYGDFTVHNEEGYPQEPSHGRHGHDEKQVKYDEFNFQYGGKTPPAEPFLANSKQDSETNFCHNESCLPNEAVSLAKSHCSSEPEGAKGEVFFGQADEKFWQPSSSCYSQLADKSTHGTTSCIVNDEAVCDKCSSRNNQPSDELQFSHGVAPPSNEDESVFEGTVYRKKEVSYKSGNFHKENDDPDPVKPSFRNNSIAEDQHQQENETKEVSFEFALQEDRMDLSFHSEDGGVTPVKSSIVDDREKLKETDEYRRAMEEEWASRQRELQIQAEEAQQLKRARKRIKAEHMRLLDMERRQQQRLEEVRETQKKDEENMSLKEALRAEVRNQLIKLEVTCLDMASLLRGLGINVSGGPYPLPQEVRAAYKRALLTFHPDRAPVSDMRQLVESEEKFKLITRMKEKLLFS